MQDFIPTPGSLSTCMFYTGLDPATGEKLYVPRGGHEKALQRALLQYRKPENYDLVAEALHKAGRDDLIGWDERCLIRPPKRGRQGISVKRKGRNASFASGGEKRKYGQHTRRNPD